jgi:hypothetical protein
VQEAVKTQGVKKALSGISGLREDSDIVREVAGQYDRIITEFRAE